MPLSFRPLSHFRRWCSKAPHTFFTDQKERGTLNKCERLRQFRKCLSPFYGSHVGELYPWSLPMASHCLSFSFSFWTRRHSALASRLSTARGFDRAWLPYRPTAS